MKVMVAASYFDLATPYFAVQHTFNHMGLNAEMHKNITWNFYRRVTCCISTAIPALS